jgi:hypothetical protein
MEERTMGLMETIGEMDKWRRRALEAEAEVERLEGLLGRVVELSDMDAEEIIIMDLQALADEIRGGITPPNPSSSSGP